MGIVALKIKLIPSSPDLDLKEIEEEIRKKSLKAGAVNIELSEEPIAFGLKAIIATLAWPEEKDTEIIESVLKKIPNVSSLDVIDYRRAVG